MAKHNELGKAGEDIAVTFLQDKGYTILERNWRFRRSEVDIICMHQEVLVFVEVKSRSTTSFGLPDSFVTKKKEMLLADSASAYMEKIGHDWEVRFDIVGIIFHNHVYQTVEHIKDAFFPGWE